MRRLGLTVALTAVVSTILLVIGYLPASAASWVPSVGVNWQVQYQGTLNLSTTGVQAYDVDGFDVSAAQVAAIHGRGAKAICYFSAGSWEDWRPDAASFPAAVKGNSNGWPGEKWLDIRQVSVLQPIMAARVNICKSKGFDAVDPDNVDGYTNSTGFPLTGAQQITYNAMLATLSHAAGLSVDLKNDVDQAAQLAPVFDFAVNEQCSQYRECGSLKPFVAAGKAVLNIEYRSTCPAKVAGFSTILKHMSLDAYRVVCP